MTTLQEESQVVVFGDNNLATSVLLSRLNECHDIVVRARVDRLAALWDSLATGNQADAVIIHVNGSVDSTNVARLLRTAYSNIQVIVVGDFQESLPPLRWLQAGADHVTLASESFEHLLSVLRGTRGGECSLPFIQQVAGQIRNLRQLDVTRSAAAHTPGGDSTETLAEREEQVARLVAQGLLNKQIARRLQLRLTTVKSYVSQILKKLEVGTRREIIHRLSPSLS